MPSKILVILTALALALAGCATPAATDAPAVPTAYTGITPCP